METAGSDWLIRGYVAVFRGTPLLVQIFLIYYGLGQFRPTLQAIGLWGSSASPIGARILALSSIPRPMAARSCAAASSCSAWPRSRRPRAFGMSRLLTFRRIVLPFALRQAIPSYSNEIILMVKGTSLASIITMMEVTGIAQRLISQTFRAIEVFVGRGRDLSHPQFHNHLGTERAGNLANTICGAGLTAPLRHHHKEN